MAANPSTSIRLLGIDEIGAEAGNDLITDGRDIPWLQDVPDEDVRTEWQATYRDVVILDRDNGRAAVYNLTEHDLSDPANYAALKSLLLSVAGE